MTYSVKGFNEIYEVAVDIVVEILLMLQSIRRLNIPTLKPATSAAMISSACDWSLFKMIFNMTLLGWLMVLPFWHSFSFLYCLCSCCPQFMFSKSGCSLGSGHLSWLLLLLGLLLLVCYQLQQSVSFFSALTAAATSSRRIWWCSQSGTCICRQSSTFGSPSVALVFYGCRFTVSLLSGPWLSDMLSCCYSFWWILPLTCTDPLSTYLLPPSSLSCSYLWSLYNRWLFQAHLFFSSGLVFGHKY